MAEPKRYTVTAALPYANGPLHIGHIAGAYLPADIFVRYLRLLKKDVIFICGSDEHGAAITIKAKKEETTPAAIVNKYHEINKKAFADFGIDFSIYHRTSSKIHHQTASEFFTNLYEKGVFEEHETEQFYDEKFNQFLADRYIFGTCPNCSYEHAYGDQCEKCGKSLSPNELINPISSLSCNAPTVKKTTHWFLPLDKQQIWLRNWIEKGILDGVQQHNPKNWKKNVVGQCLSWMKDGDGLQPRSVTRDLDWGVKVPLPNAVGKVLYVWLDAPIGYISATKKWALDNNRDWKKYWCDKDTHLIHFIGKDNIVFHCIIFPAILKNHGGFILPENVPANEFLNLEGKKLSTSRNWAVWLHEYLEDFPGKQDELRYVLTSIAPESKDSEFTWKDYQARVNNELVAILGNFVNRAVVLTHKYFDGIIPTSGNNSDDKKLLDFCADAAKKVGKLILSYKFREAQFTAIGIAREGNRYLAENEPWKLIKTNPQRVGEIVHTALTLCAYLTSVLEPFLPNTCSKLRSMLNIDAIKWIAIGGNENVFPEGHSIAEGALLFEKIENTAVEKQINKLKQQEKMNEPVEEVKEITFDEFSKLDISIATIVNAEKVENANKLLKLQVALANEERTIVSGIAEHYKPEDIIGKQVCLLTNLAPRKIRGIESKGMILMAEDEAGNLCFVTPEKAIGNGSSVR